MEKKVFNLIVLDESGSMCSIERATVSGLNETIQTIKSAQQKHPEQQHFVSLMSFNSEGRKYHYDLTPADKIQTFDGRDYAPSACTPLYDAIGCGIARLRRQTTDDDQVLVTIITDGLENDSHEYTFKDITALIDTMKARGWMVTYIGANHDVLKTAAEMHIDNSLQFDASEEGVVEMMREDREARMALYDCACRLESPTAVMNEIGKNFFRSSDKRQGTSDK